MAKKTLDIGSRFVNAFGFVGNTGESLQGTGFEDTVTGAEIYVKDGRSSYENFTMRTADLELKFAYGGLSGEDNTIFAPPALCSFTHGKRIGSTIVSSNDEQGNEVAYGEVVENYGRKPVEITIKGILIDMANHQYPGDKVKKLVTAFNLNKTWAVEGQIFRDHVVREIYIVSMDDGPVQGYMDTWSFTINAVSIKPVSYFFKKNN